MLNATQNLVSFRGYYEELWLHVYFAKASNAAGQLEKGLYAFENAHVGKADFLQQSALWLVLQLVRHKP